jgi:hypothetical protein
LINWIYKLWEKNSRILKKNEMWHIYDWFRFPKTNIIRGHDQIISKKKGLKLVPFKILLVPYIVYVQCIYLEVKCMLLVQSLIAANKTKVYLDGMHFIHSWMHCIYLMVIAWGLDLQHATLCKPQGHNSLIITWQYPIGVPYK